MEQFKKGLSDVFKTTSDQDSRAPYIEMLNNYKIMKKKTTIHLSGINEDISEEKKVNKRVKTPHIEGLNTIGIAETYLDYIRAELFRSVVYKLLWSTHHLEVHAMLTVYLVSDRVQRLTEQDLDQWPHVLQFLVGAKRSRIVLCRNDDTCCADWCVHAVFEVRTDTDQMHCQGDNVGFIPWQFI